MHISILCSDEFHPVNDYLKKWALEQQSRHAVELVSKKKELSGGDILFLISCSEIIDASTRNLYGSSLVLHASDLPDGRGWSPHIWKIVEGAPGFTLSLLEAEDKVDTGRIWKKLYIPISKDALWDEINHSLFTAELELMSYAVNKFDVIEPKKQDQNLAVKYYPKRTPEDSRIDPGMSIEEQFDQIRVCDPVRYPAIFELHGQKYKLLVEKVDD